MARILFKSKVVLVFLCLAGIWSANSYAAEIYEGHTLVVLQPLTQKKAGVIKLFPDGRTKCVNCSVELAYTQNTVLTVNGEKEKLSPFTLMQLAPSNADVISYEQGIAGSINLSK